MLSTSTSRLLLLTPLLQRPPRFFRIISTTNTLKNLQYLHPKPLTNLHKINNNRPNIVFQSLIGPFFVISHIELHNIRGGGASGVARVSTMSSGGDNQGEQFQLSSSTTLKIEKVDITKWSIDGSSDAIVNPANEQMLGGGGADGAIHRAAGPELRAACYKVPEVRPTIRCPTGEARITRGFKLPASHVIHTVGPIYDGHSNPEALLRNAYKNSLDVAKANNIKYIAFPAISCGVYGYPFDEAATVALSTVKENANDLNEVHFVLFSDDIYDVWVKKANELLQK